MNSVDKYLKARRVLALAHSQHHSYRTIQRLEREIQYAAEVIRTRVMFHWAKILQEDLAATMTIVKARPLRPMTDCACGGTGIVPSIDPDQEDGYEPCGECPDGARRAAERMQDAEESGAFGHDGMEADPMVYRDDFIISDAECAGPKKTDSCVAKNRKAR